MLDPPLNGNKARGRTTEERGHSDVVERTANEVAQPDGNSAFSRTLKMHLWSMESKALAVGVLGDRKRPRANSRIPNAVLEKPNPART